MTMHRLKRVPKLSHSKNRGIGWHVSYRDASTGMPKKHRFGMMPEHKARVLYHQWLAEHLNDNRESIVNVRKSVPKKSVRLTTPKLVESDLIPGSLIQVASNLLNFEESRTRTDGEPRARGTIDSRVCSDRKKHLHDFLDYMNQKHGQGTLKKMQLADLSMADVEGFNRTIVDAGYSASQVTKRMQMVKALINRAGRPEHGLQTLAWNWDSKDIAHGKPTEERRFPLLNQLIQILKNCEHRERTMVWMAIGLGFGQHDLAAVRVRQIDSESYDLRRGKTGVERFGKTPPLVWAYIQFYLEESPRKDSDLMFTTRTGMPLVHKRSDAIQQWWNILRRNIGETKETLSGFYILRHLGATEFGSRPSCSISDMKRWLGHAASSRVADIYMKPIAPENRTLIEWVRSRLASNNLNYSLRLTS
ncbi:MAG: hypothetical protein IH984_06895 [Planctomycetes bacterium]|nr:hypothetical protein [Planctomycetota bacterium]